MNAQNQPSPAAADTGDAAAIIARVLAATRS